SIRAFASRKVMHRQEEEVKIGKHIVRIRELSMDDESKARALSQVWDSKKKIFETDSARFELEVVFRSIVPESWPEEFGSLSMENLKSMGARYLRPILKAWKDLNTLPADAADFLDSQSQSETSPRPSQAQ
ncbi:MAG: hypothetical protein ACREBQ_09625, partial [Nitrososphaerales archaeon]